MRAIDRMSLEIWREVFLEFDSSENKATIYACLIVNRMFYSAMQGAPLLEDFVFKNTKQLPLLLFYLLKNPTMAKEVHLLRFQLAKDRLTDIPANQITHDIASLVSLLQVLPRLVNLFDPPISQLAYQQSLSAIKAMRQVVALSFRDYSSIRSLANICQPIAITDVYDIVAGSNRIFSLQLEGYNEILTVSAPGALSHLTEISLHYAQLTGTSFSRLLLSCGSQLSTLEVTSCRRLPIRDFISAVLDNAPNLEVLRTVKCFSEDVPPIQHDYLSRLPKLTELRLSGNSLAPSGLCYLGPLVWSVTLQDCSLSAYEIASSVLCIDEDRSESKTCITFYLTSSEYDDEAQKMLRRCFRKRKHVNLVFDALPAY